MQIWLLARLVCADTQHLCCKISVISVKKLQSHLKKLNFRLSPHKIWGYCVKFVSNPLTTYRF